jgi:putative transposase
MGYDPLRHHRRSIRLPGWDYTRSGVYFVTIVTHDCQCLFDDGRFRGITERTWRSLARRFRYVGLDEYVVMPNHVHGIVVIQSDVPAGVQHTTPESRSVLDVVPACGAAALPGPRVQPGSLGAIIRTFKSITTRDINRVRGTPGAPVWQRNYYERIVRDERGLAAIRRYIRDNPGRWAEDRENPAASVARGAGRARR